MTKFVAATLALLCGAVQAQSLQSRDLNGDGAVDAYYQASQNLTWLADANLYATQGGVLNANPFSPGDSLMPGQLRFSNALSFVDNLAIGAVDDWRLPERLVPAGGPNTSVCSATACDPWSSWPSELSFLSVALGGSAGPFTNLQNGSYLTSTSGGVLEMRNLLAGTSLVTDETAFAYGFVLAVRSGDVGAAVTPVPEPSTYALMLAGMLGLALHSRRRKGSDAGA